MAQAALSPCAAPPRDDDAVGAGNLGRADDGPQVVRVGDAVAQDDEGRFPPLPRQGENVVQLGVPGRGGNGDNPLVRARGAHAIQFAPVAFLHGHPLLARKLNDVADAGRAARRDKQLVQLPPARSASQTAFLPSSRLSSSCPYRSLAAYIEPPPPRRGGVFLSFSCTALTPLRGNLTFVLL